MFQFYGNMLSQASRSMAAGVLSVGLVLCGFGGLVLMFPEFFAMLAAFVFFLAGVGLVSTAVKIFIVQRQIDKTINESEPYRENVRIHIEDRDSAL